MSLHRFNKPRHSILWANLPFLLALFGLYLTSLYSFLVFHALAEFFSILVAFSIFTISWNARRFLNGSYMVLLGVAYLCVGGLDILHTLAFKGMGIFTAYDTNLPTQFWIAARYLESFSILAVPLLINRQLNPEKTLILYLILSFALIGSIFGRVFPVCYIEGVGLTPFKIISEYLICGILLVATLLMVWKRREFEPSIFKLLIASIVFTIATELSFISYINVYGYEHIVGHLFKVLSFYFIYRAIVVTSIVNPYDSLFWDLNQTKERLRLFIEHAPAALAMFDRDMRYLSVSRRWLSDYNLADQDLIGKSHYEIFPELSLQWKEIHRRGLKGEVIRTEDDRFVRADGSVQVLRWEVRPWHDEKGAVAGIVIFTEDITDRKQTEETLRRQAQLLHLSYDAIIVWQLDGGIESWNRGAEELYGFNEREALGRVTHELFKTIHPIPWSEIDSIMRQTGRWEGELRHYTKDGREVIVSARHQIVQGADGSERVLEINRDITESKQVEAALRESERRLLGVLESMPDAFVSFDPDMRYTYVNANAERLQVTDREELLGRDVRVVYPDAESRKTISQYERVGKEQKPVTLTSYHAGFDRWVEVRAFPTPDGVSVFYKDVSESVKADENLAKAHEQALHLARFPEENPNPVVRVNVAGVVLYCNPSSAIASGWNCQPGQLINQRLLPLVMRSIEEKRQTQEDLEIGEKFYDVLVVPFPGESYINLYGRDITEVKQAGDAIKQARDELEMRVKERTAELSIALANLEQKNQELEEFVFIVSHDLQEPLRKIETFSDRINIDCEPLLDEKGKVYLNRVLNSATRMRHLLRELLNFSRVTTGTESFNEIDLLKTAREAADIFEIPIKDSGAQVEIDKMPVVEADENRIRQLFQNLIGNALKFRDSKTPVIRIYSRDIGSKFCEIIVKDNGIGFERQYSQQIFKPFERLHGRSTYEGMGMGLAICRKIVERHGGAIRAESEPGKGSTFIIKLPLKQAGMEGKEEK